MLVNELFWCLFFTVVIIGINKLYKLLFEYLISVITIIWINKIHK